VPHTGLQTATTAAACHTLVDIAVDILCLQLGCAEGLPEKVTEDLLSDDGFLQKFHHALMEVRQCSRRLPPAPWHPLNHDPHTHQ
jgi:hypothetical protein